MRVFRRPRSRSRAACAVLLFGSVLASLGAGCYKQESDRAPGPTSSATEGKAGPEIPVAPPSKGAIDLSTAIVQVAKQNIPAVAHIEVVERQEVENPFFSFEADPFFRRFFGVPQGPRKFEREQRGLGTGMIIDAEGHILTNNHVVAGATKIQILLASGEEYPGKVVGTDPKTDLAVVKIAATGSLPHVTFGDSDTIEVGEWVVAIGHPRGLDQTVTQGIISAKHRRGITDPSSYEDFLQTDAAINPGNSGGPLLNLHGHVIGVNAAIASQSGGSEGIGFAIPSNMAIHVVRQLIGKGKVERGWMGVSVQDLTPDLARSLDLKGTAGALIADVVKGSPAEKAGVRRGDVIVSFAGKDVADAGALRNAAASTPAGREVKVVVVRKGSRQELLVTVGDFRAATQLLAASVKDRLGASVRAVTTKDAQRYGLESPRGVVITGIDPQGPCARVGLEVEDMILEVGGRSVDSVEGLVDLVSSLKAKERVPVLALDHRTGNTGYVQIVTR
ncbi:MAG: Do family serine endopeptidase [Deltaproteobacteria bacterium]|nr:Do family serine endopeptidase [Deltaproteobacteria bacterium]